jgi:NAD(P)H-hydrate epimerase
MENAGRGAAEVIARILGPVQGRRVVVVCGKGNNGGDGFVAARHLLLRGARVAVWLAGRAEEVGGDARMNLDAWRAAGQPVTELADADGVARDHLRASLAGAELVVDALLGTGVHGPVAGVLADAVAAINEAGRPVCALDLPSGLPSDGEAPAGPVVRAHVTATFGLPKLGLAVPPGLELAGRVELVDLGVPRAWLAAGLRTALLEPADVASLLPPRPVDAHKGRYGHLLVMAGSLGKTGAAVLACLGALRAGTGLVTCALPRSQQPVVAGAIAEAMTEALPETAAGSLSAQAVDRLLALLHRMDAGALGPGAGLDPETQTALREVIRQAQRPLVVDADALTALAGHLALVRNAAGPRLLTPHPGEAARLLGVGIPEVQADRLGAARRLAEATGAIVALKGARTIVAAPDGEAVVNPTGNPGMASGGMGDVLTGIAGGLLAQGLDPGAALRAAVYLHGLAGDLAAEARGAAGLLATDVAGTLPAAIRRVAGAPSA